MKPLHSWKLGCFLELRLGKKLSLEIAPMATGACYSKVLELSSSLINLCHSTNVALFSGQDACLKITAFVFYHMVQKQIPTSRICFEDEWSRSDLAHIAGLYFLRRRALFTHKPASDL
ncbi:uncharacterized protein [Physcomitrium patens]|uniref:uncharacterized protein isoform X3 n=1 Tax=Physcomitrium patens TaxID=3218 RepID=UPI003CCDCE32